MERRGGLGLAALGALGRRLLWALPAYAAGLLGLGAGAVVLALALYAGWRRRRRARERGMRAAERLHREEEAAVRAAARGELPAWVSFPDVERAEWLNKVLAQAWPFLGRYLEKLLQDSVAPAIRASSAHLQSFTFTRVDLGQKPLRVLGVQAHPGTHKKQILLDLNISYVGDVQIDVEVKKFFCKAGVKGMQLHGVLRIILEPLLGDAPIVGALSLFFIRRPTLDINWTGMTNLLDIPGLSSMSDSMIMDSIASYLVLPNRLLVPLLPDLPEAARLRWPLPRGVVRVSLVAARALRSKDRFLGGLVQGRSDPYALLRVGTQAATSRVIGDSLDPVWDEMYEFMVHEVPGQELEVELFDKDPDKDDLLGRMKLDLGEVLRARVMDEWFPLQEGGQGRLHLRLEWLSLLSDASKLDQVLEKNQKIVAKPDPPSSAILVVYLDRAEGLPVRKAGKEPNPVVQVSVQDVTRESKVVCNTSAPVWEDAFRFFLHNPRNQDVDFQVGPQKSRLWSLPVSLRPGPVSPQVRAEAGPALGSLTLPLARLLPRPGLGTDGWEPLAGGGRILLRAQLGVLVPLEVEEGAARRGPEGGDPERPQEEEEEEEPRGEEDEQRGAGGLRQRLVPADRRPQPTQGPRVLLSLRFQREQRRLVAIVHSCRDLRAASKDLPDPYVSLALLPERSRATKRKTGVQKRTLNPEFNERFEWELPPEEAPRRRLEATVKSSVNFVTREKETLGKLQLELAQVDLSEGDPRWYELQDERSLP
ncbi:LOW QUALITY PROTEIN: extended synaptotagmin-1 [Agelaius tricolor]|uniref:LOW QUALITY PROTEIN: extended synaptotagmin-1 n=1 Tax=Agelaius tricolor TaxID=9191 RepID=UPI0039F228AC